MNKAHNLYMKSAFLQGMYAVCLLTIMMMIGYSYLIDTVLIVVTLVYLQRANVKNFAYVQGYGVIDKVKEMLPEWKTDTSMIEIGYIAPRPLEHIWKLGILSSITLFAIGSMLSVFAPKELMLAARFIKIFSSLSLFMTIGAIINWILLDRKIYWYITMGKIYQISSTLKYTQEQTDALENLAREKGVLRLE